MITGQLILMDKGVILPDDPRHVVMVYGVLGMSAYEAEKFCSDHHQRTVVGGAFAQVINLNLRGELTRIPGHFRGQDASAMLTSPIWRI